MKYDVKITGNGSYDDIIKSLKELVEDLERVKISHNVNDLSDKTILLHDGTLDVEIWRTSSTNESD